MREQAKWGDTQAENRGADTSPSIQEIKMRTNLITSLVFLFGITTLMPLKADKPNVILVMSDDQGWSQTGYYGHPIARTPNLDDMATRGLRMDRFYSGAPFCVPTRATVLTGRTKTSHDHHRPQWSRSNPPVTEHQ